MNTAPGSAVKVVEHEALAEDAVDQKLKTLRHFYSLRLLCLVGIAVSPFLVGGIQTPRPWSITRNASEVVFYTGISVAAAFFSIRWAVDAFRLAFPRTK